jgi:hypothetical protein
MHYHQIPGSCEADIGAAITHAVVRHVFDRPDFQRHPLPDTAKEALIGARYAYPSRLAGALAERLYL